MNDQLYKNGEGIVLNIEDCDNLLVGVIQTIVVRSTKVYFVTRNYNASRHWLRFFEANSREQSLCSFVESSTLSDYKPLILRGTVDSYIFVQHHPQKFFLCNSLLNKF